MNLEITATKDTFKRKYQIECSFNHILKPTYIVPMADLIFTTVTPREVFGGQTIINVKGSGDFDGEYDGLLELRGEIVNEGSQTKEEVFTSIKTKLKEFRSSKEAVYQIHELRSSNLQPFFQPSDLIKEDHQFFLSELKCNMEFLEPRRFWLFGETPSVFGGISIEIKEDFMTFNLWADQMDTISLPMETRFKNFFSGFNRLTGQSITKSFFEKQTLL